MLTKILSSLATAVVLCSAAFAAQASSFTIASLNGPEGPPDARYWVDINNDGKDDYCVLLDPNGNSRLACYLSDGQGLANAPVYFDQIGSTSPDGLRWIDQNGDGKVDMCKVSERGDNFYVECRRGMGFSPEVDFPVGPDHRKASGAIWNMQPGASRTGFKFVDLNNDGLIEYCVLITHPMLKTGRRIECTMAGTGNFVSVPSWAADLPGVPHAGEGAGFHDVNGDGLPDFCFVSENIIRCLLGSHTGPFTGGEWRSTDLGSGNQTDGAAFIDINNDGKTDYCRPVEVGSARRLMCRLSNGAGWQASDTGSLYMDAGWGPARWWVDINGDGLPDYCRAVGGGNPASGQDYNAINLLSCRLASGDSALFVDQDISLDNVNFGTATGARAFCDVFGTGVSTLCRATFRQEPDYGNQTCYERPNSGTTVCVPGVRNIHGLMVGIEGQSLPQQPLMTRFSDGVGAETRIAYAPGSSTRVYFRSGYGEPNLYLQRTGSQIVMPGKPLVFETRAWREGSEQKLTGNARYYYKDLRSSPLLGSQGFAERWMLTEGSNSIEHHAYYQGLENFEGSRKGDYRELGQLRYQQRFAMTGSLPAQVPGSQFGTYLGQILGRIASAPNLDVLGPGYALTQRTTYTLGDTSPTVNPRVRVPIKTKTERWDIGTAGERIALPEQLITTTVDASGNVTRLDEETIDRATGLTYRKTTENIYGQDNPATWTLGRLTRSKVTSTAPSADQQLAVRSISAGTSPRASEVASSLPAVGQKPAPNQISPAVLSAILQLLLED